MQELYTYKSKVLFWTILCWLKPSKWPTFENNGLFMSSLKYMKRKQQKTVYLGSVARSTDNNYISLVL